MSGLDNNPFADPFKDPAVQRAMQPSPNSNPQQQPAVAGYGGTSLSNPRPAAAQIGVPLSEEDLFRQQEELRRREQELQRRQQEFQQQQRAQMGGGGGGGGLPGGGGPAPAHNWPPLPAFVPLQPCFYQDIDVEIPVHFQETVRFVYYVYLVYVLALAANVVGALLYMLFAGGAFGLFLLAIIQMAIFSPCAFLLWFRPVYKAFRDDSSFNFMMFFLVLFFHTIFCFVQTLGFSYAVGWFTTIEVFKISIFVGILMLVPTLAFTAAFVGMCLSLVKVHRFYRGNFTLDKARQEFSNNVMADRNVQNAANTAARAAAAHAVNEVASGRY